MLVVAIAVALEVQAQIEERPTKYALGAQQQSDQEPSDSSVAVEERVDSLELGVRERGLHEHRRRVGIVVDELLEGAHCCGDLLPRRRDETCRRGSGPAEPVLVAAELPAPAMREAFHASGIDSESFVSPVNGPAAELQL